MGQLKTDKAWIKWMLAGGVCLMLALRAYEWLAR